MLLAGKNPANFVSSDATRDFVAEVERTIGISSQKLLMAFRTGPWKGTWGHKYLAMRCARYCSPAVELAMYRIVEGVLDGSAAQQHIPSIPCYTPNVSSIQQETAAVIQGTAALTERATAVDAVIARTKDLMSSQQEVVEQQLHLQAQLAAAHNQMRRMPVDPHVPPSGHFFLKDAVAEALPHELTPDTRHGFMLGSDGNKYARYQQLAYMLRGLEPSYNRKRSYYSSQKGQHSVGERNYYPSRHKARAVQWIQDEWKKSNRL